MTSAARDPWFAAVVELANRPPEPISTDPALAARLTPPPQGDWRPADVDVHDAVVPGPHGDVPVRVYRGEGDGWFVWCHGGAWVAGDLDMPEADATSREVAARSGRTVASVDYRLALRGVHHPVPLDDVVAATEWAAAQAGGPVALGGASAGANLAAGAALRLRDAGNAIVDRLVAIYPLVHPVLPAPSPELADKLATLSPAARFAPGILRPLVENYLGAPVAEASPYAMPALGDLRGLPPTLVHNAEYDALRSSGEAFARALADAGIDVRSSCAPGVAHGHLNAPWLPQASASIDEIVRFLASP